MLRFCLALERVKKLKVSSTSNEQLEYVDCNIFLALLNKTRNHTVHTQSFCTRQLWVTIRPGILRVTLTIHAFINSFIHYRACTDALIMIIVYTCSIIWRHSFLQTFLAQLPAPLITRLASFPGRPSITYGGRMVDVWWTYAWWTLASYEARWTYAWWTLASYEARWTYGGRRAFGGVVNRD